jgi:hypothetical protein
LVCDAEGNLLRERLNVVHVLRKRTDPSGSHGWEIRSLRPEDPSSALTEALFVGL